MLSRLVITFLPRSKRLLISWLQSPSAVVSNHFLHIKFIIMIVLENTLKVLWSKLTHTHTHNKVASATL